MNNIKTFIERFAQIEAETSTLYRIPDLGKYNASVEKYYTFFCQLLVGAMDFYPINELLDDDYEIFEGAPPVTPRHLFKISKYYNEKYGDVWVAFTSIPDACADYKTLDIAIFVIKENGELKIAKFWIYSNYKSDGRYYQWEEGKGYPDISFQNLTGPVEIERYQEPVDINDGLKHYNDNI